MLLRIVGLQPGGGGVLEVSSRLGLAQHQLPSSEALVTLGSCRYIKTKAAGGPQQASVSQSPARRTGFRAVCTKLERW